MAFLGDIGGRRGGLAAKLGQMHWFLLLNIVAIATLGVAVLFSAASGAAGLEGAPREVHAGLAIDHVLRFMLMLAVALFVAMLPLKLWAALAFPAYFVGVVLLIMVELFGFTAGGATRWLDIGFTRIQPSELMKLAVPLALANYYHKLFAAGRTQVWIHIPAVALIVVPTALVLMQPDLGTAMMIFASGAAVIFFAGLDMKVILGILGLGAAATPIAYFFGLHDYQRQRVTSFLDPASDPLGAGYQLQQALIAIGSGGFGGKGYMEGAQKQLEYIPEQHTDFIFTIPAEEFGFVGSVAILAAWVLVLIQGMLIATKSRSAFGGLAAAGFVATLMVYVVINIGMVMGLLPVVGIPLPLISYGGTVMVTVMMGFGLLQCVHLNSGQDLRL